VVIVWITLVGRYNEQFTYHSLLVMFSSLPSKSPFVSGTWPV